MDGNRDMEPLFGFAIFAVVAFIVSIIAGKRSGAGIGFIYFWLCVQRHLELLF